MSIPFKLMGCTRAFMCPPLSSNQYTNDSSVLNNLAVKFYSYYATYFYILIGKKKIYLTRVNVPTRGKYVHIRIREDDVIITTYANDSWKNVNFTSMIRRCYPLHTINTYTVLLRAYVNT